MGGNFNLCSFYPKNTIIALCNARLYNKKQAIPFMQIDRFPENGNKFSDQRESKEKALQSTQKYDAISGNQDKLHVHSSYTLSR